MNYLVAVSGGVDSVVLLDMLSRSEHRLIVAHVDHGIREDSAADARFVAALARKYQLPFVTTRFELGAGASEDQARTARYGFLREQATLLGAKIVTAHHQDDVIETIAINLQRGTGWRGLAVMGGEEIVRPLLPMAKTDIYTYALRHHLEWVEDSTNQTDAYQRNRVRRRLGAGLSTEARGAVLQLRAAQLQLRHAIAYESRRIIAGASIDRQFMTMLDEATAIELLGTMIEHETGLRPTRPQLARAVLAIKVMRPGARYQVGQAIELYFTSRNFAVNRV